MHPARFEYEVPATLEEALAVLAERGEEVRVLAGGQSLIPMMKLRLAMPAALVDVNRLPGLDHIERADGQLRLGALVRHNAIATSDLVRETNHVMAAAAPWIADPLVRNLGTIGGSLAHADPEGDWASVMLAWRGEVVATGPGGERVIPVRELITDMFTTSLQPGELVTEVRVPIPSRPSGGAYLKLERKVGDYATVAVATRLEPGLRGGHRRLAAHRAAGQTDREPHLHRLRLRLLHARRAGAEAGRQDPGPAGEHGVGQRRLLRRRPAHPVQGRPVLHRDRLVRLPGGVRRDRGCVHQPGAGRGGLPVLVPGDRGVVPDRAAGAERGLRAGPRPGRAAHAQRHPARPVPLPVGHRFHLRHRRLPARPAPGHGQGELRGPAPRAGRGPRAGPAPRHRPCQLHRGGGRREPQGVRHRGHQDVRLPRAAGAPDRQGHPQAGGEEPGPGSRDDVRPDRGRGTGHPGHRHRRAGGRHRQHALRPRHLRLPQHAGRRRGHGHGGPQAADKARVIAAHLLEAAEEDLDWEPGRFFVKGTPSRGVTIQDVAEADEHGVPPGAKAVPMACASEGALPRPHR